MNRTAPGLALAILALGTAWAVDPPPREPARIRRCILTTVELLRGRHFPDPSIPVIERNPGARVLSFEMEKAGFEVTDSRQLSNLQDGFYIGILFQDGKLVMSPVIPDRSIRPKPSTESQLREGHIVHPDSPKFYASHRSLLNGHSTDTPVILGFEFRVLNGEVTHFSNRSDTFHGNETNLRAGVDRAIALGLPIRENTSFLDYHPPKEPSVSPTSPVDPRNVADRHLASEAESFYELAYGHRSEARALVKTAKVLFQKIPDPKTAGFVNLENVQTTVDYLMSTRKELFVSPEDKTGNFLSFLAVYVFRSYQLDGLGFALSRLYRRTSPQERKQLIQVFRVLTDFDYSRLPEIQKELGHTKNL